MLIDAFEPEGVTALAKDSIFMMPHLGVLTQVHPQAALEVFERDCLIMLGSCVAPAGQAKPGSRCFRYSLSSTQDWNGQVNGELHVGEIKLIPLATNQITEIMVAPTSRFDAGAGRGKVIKREIKGGTVGLILDARGRPLQLPEDQQTRKQQLTEWIEAMNVYPKNNRD